MLVRYLARTAIDPTACIVNQPRRICSLKQIRYPDGIELAPAFIERYPPDNARMISEVLHHRPHLSLDFISNWPRTLHVFSAGVQKLVGDGWKILPHHDA